MNIAIVDEDKIDLETAEAFLRFYIKKFWAEYESKIHIEVFQRTEEFLQIFCAGLYHAVILAAEMEGVANYIRAQGDDNTKIIFLKFNDNSVGGGGEL